MTSVTLIVGFGPWIVRLSGDAAMGLLLNWRAVSLVMPLALLVLALDRAILNRFVIATAVSAGIMLLRGLLMSGDTGKNSESEARKREPTDDASSSTQSLMSMIDQGPPCEGTLHVLVVGCNNVLPADSNGASDVYVKLRVGQQEGQTKVKPKTLDPVFDETLDMNVSQNPETWSLRAEVWDRDKVCRDDFLGEAVVDLRNEFADHSSQIAPLGGWDAATTDNPIDRQYELSDPKCRLSSNAMKALAARKVDIDTRAVQSGRCGGDHPYGTVHLRLSFTPFHVAADRGQRSTVSPCPTDPIDASKVGGGSSWQGATIISQLAALRRAWDTLDGPDVNNLVVRETDV